MFTYRSKERAVVRVRVAAPTLTVCVVLRVVRAVPRTDAGLWFTGESTRGLVGREGTLGEGDLVRGGGSGSGIAESGSGCEDKDENFGEHGCWVDAMRLLELRKSGVRKDGGFCCLSRWLYMRFLSELPTVATVSSPSFE